MDDLPPPLEDATVLVEKIKTNIEQKKKFSENAKKINSDLLNLEITDKPKVPKLISESITPKKETTVKSTKTGQKKPAEKVSFFIKTLK